MLVPSSPLVADQSWVPWIVAVRRDPSIRTKRTCIRLAADPSASSIGPRQYFSYSHGHWRTGRPQRRTSEREPELDCGTMTLNRLPDSIGPSANPPTSNTGVAAPVTIRYPTRLGPSCSWLFAQRSSIGCRLPRRPRDMDSPAAAWTTVHVAPIWTGWRCWVRIDVDPIRHTRPETNRL